MALSRKIGGTLALVLGAYFLALRPRLLRWGATDVEVNEPYPGADLIPGGTRSATMAVTIDAPPARVWPWLVQMGYGRAGWYSWDRLDNFGHSSAEELHPPVADPCRGGPPGAAARRLGGGGAGAGALPRPAHRDTIYAATAQPTGPPPRCSTDSLWGFLLEPLPGGRTRLVVSGYSGIPPALAAAAREPALPGAEEHWIMQTRQFTDTEAPRRERRCGYRGRRRAALATIAQDWFRVMDVARTVAGDSQQQTYGQLNLPKPTLQPATARPPACAVT